MIIIGYAGYELEKAKPNTSEDFFNRSEVTYVLNNQEKTFSVLYVRYFEEIVQEITPFEGNPVYKVEEQDVYLRDIVAIACLVNNKELRAQKRLYLNEVTDFQRYFDEGTVVKVQEILAELHKNKRVEIA
ncbi:hypothetical protein CN445_00050 [Bacillus cereus]|uniref:Uncharacterized protein n=1 Tax=Bacillus nitratireducens TaxID=2026193 RepID=A0ABU6P6R8_9BACI|nr:hypothetical protein [Bacillus nitratireducens]EJS55721.1 hypothetical protein ICG_03983 [Bacillus cereus BAG1X1-3]EOO78647.1 hypothetical protein IC7_00779 [Bacillus cereus BAG1O-1]OSY01551.1 hypothetical protein BTJ45_00614 [Bacillus mycoides]PDY25948.1 hypothetical protein COM83_00565 [Bacillus cereus]MDR4170561.1 hypothetical protein [Bacillus nitratireducens]